MEIGGSELTLNRALQGQDVAALVQWVRSFWPAAVLQNADATGSLSNDDPLTCLGQEFFIFSSQESLDSWSQEGRTDQNADQMVNVLRSDDSTTLVVDRVDSDLGRHMFEFWTDLDRKAQTLEETAEPDYVPKSLPPQPTSQKLQELVRKIGQLGFQVASMPYGTDDDPAVEYFMWVLNVPSERLCEIHDKAIELALDLYEDAALPVIIGVADPKKTRQLFEARSP